uniref:Uncharacterized protein n=1 Tax=Callithrix jacchus TaxID=9483 RepID=A0A5F4WIX4_CALJA
ADSRLPETALEMTQFLKRQGLAMLARLILNSCPQAPGDRMRKHLETWAREE